MSYLLACIALANSFKFTNVSVVLESNARSLSSMSRYSLSLSLVDFLFSVCSLDGSSASTRTPARSSSSATLFPSGAEVALVSE